MVLLVGLLVRAFATVTYWPAFWFFDGGRYIQVSREWVPDTQRPFGYSALLRLADWTGSLATVTIAQHVVGLALSAAIYGFLRHRGTATWLAVLGSAPIALDAYQITIEHYILAETLFTALLLGALALLLWRKQPSTAMVVGAGLLLAAAGLTRTVGLPLVAIVLVYLIVAKFRWQQVALFVLAWTIPLAGYVAWYHAEHGVYQLGQYEGRFLYGRVATFADCERLDLAPQHRELCPVESLQNRRNPSFYVWDFASPQFQYPLATDDDVFAGFAREAIRSQPVDYADTVTDELLSYFQLRPNPICLGDWEMPHTTQLICHPKMSGNVGFDTAMASPGYRDPGPLTAVLSSYHHYVYLPGMLWGVGIVVAVWGGIYDSRRRRQVGPMREPRRDGIDAMMLSLLGLALLVLAVATSMSDYRYGVPTLALIPPAGALAWHCLGSRLEWDTARGRQQ